MNLFAIVAGMMALIHLVAAFQRPRPAIFVSAVLWLLYTVYEHLIATGVLCDANCNIRVDLVLFFPILALVTFCAYRSYTGQSGQMKIIGAVLGVFVLLVLLLMLESYGHGAWSVIALVATLAIGVYAIRSRSKRNKNRPDAGATP